MILASAVVFMALLGLAEAAPLQPPSIFNSPGYQPCKPDEPETCNLPRNLAAAKETKYQFYSIGQYPQETWPAIPQKPIWIEIEGTSCTFAIGDQNTKTASMKGRCTFTDGFTMIEQGDDKSSFPDITNQETRSSLWLYFSDDEEKVLRFFRTKNTN